MVNKGIWYTPFTRNVRTGDLDLCVSCLSETTDIVFEMNHMNYAS